MTLRILPVAAVALALLVPATASAAPPRSAEAFAAAGERLTFALRAQGDAIERGFAEEFARCEAAIQRQRVPRRARERFTHLIVVAVLQPTLERVLPSMRQFVADLDAVPTRDPALRSGRAGWRATVAVMEAVPELEGPCEHLERWAASGYAADQAPPLPLAGMRAFLRDADGGLASADRKVGRAVRRLRRLGVPRRRARHFGGTVLGEVFAEDSLPDVAGEAGPVRRR